MKRRDFLAAAGLAGLAPLGALATAEAAGSPTGREFYELRLYTIASPEKQKAMEAFFCEAAIPAWGRMDIGPVGVFKTADESSPNLFVLLPHKSLESVATAGAKLMADAAFLKAGAAVLDAPFKDPAYKRIESSLLLAFEAVPKLHVPTKQDTRVFQLRTYESHSAKKALKKIEMFQSGGELDIFRKVGLPVVFFGQALIGTKLPNLTYMVSFESEEAKDKAWKGFMADPGWLKLKDDPQYRDTVSNITNIVLRPAGCSQI